MRSLLENKRLILSLAALALVALTVLAVSLNQIPFREAQHFGRREPVENPLPADDMTQILVDVPLWKQVLVWVLVIVMVVLIALLLSPEMRKRLLRIIIRVAVTFWAMYFLMKNYGEQLFGWNLARGTEGQASVDSNVPMPVFQPPQVSPAFSYVISFAFALLWLAILWGLYRGWQRYTNLMKMRKPLDELARIARSSLDDLSSGRNSSDVIINCYLRMSDVVSDKRHLYRAAAMTPSEFAQRLEQAGLPGDAVTRLTRLFEAVRYGDRKSGPKDVNEAVSCLKTILLYCGEPV
jgi:hypothetical protein